MRLSKIFDHGVIDVSNDSSLLYSLCMQLLYCMHMVLGVHVLCYVSFYPQLIVYASDQLESSCSCKVVATGLTWLCYKISLQAPPAEVMYRCFI